MNKKSLMSLCLNSKHKLPSMETDKVKGILFDRDGGRSLLFWNMDGKLKLDLHHRNGVPFGQIKTL